MPSSAAPLTPRAQVARVLVGAVAAMIVGAGPAVAWDLSTQLPRAASSRPRAPSVWGAAGKQLKAAAGGIARVYLPRTSEPPASSEPAAVATPAPVSSTKPFPTPTVATGPKPAPSTATALELMPVVIE